MRREQIFAQLSQASASRVGCLSISARDAFACESWAKTWAKFRAIFPALCCEKPGSVKIRVNLCPNFFGLWI
jgi:hypothetical protein